MTDREMLKLAAKAAGPLQGHHRAPIGEPAILCANDLYWCPLQDDGDALRLAVKLWFELDVGRERVVVRTPQGDKVLLSDTDLLAATRRAIVRAAAEVGKSMEKE